VALYARPSEDGQRVLCGVKDCGRELAWVLEGGVRGEKVRVVWFGPGWIVRADDGVWVFKEKGSRRPPGGRDRPPGPSGWVPWLPCEAKCPDCGFQQTLDHEVLNVSTHAQPPDLMQACLAPRCPSAVRYYGYCAAHGGQEVPLKAGKSGRFPGMPRPLFSGDELERWGRVEAARKKMHGV